mgnify:CR=1 FL=1
MTNSPPLTGPSDSPPPVPPDIASSASPPQADRATEIPPGLRNAFGFQLFNTMSWSLIIGTPILLFMKEMGASGLVLGVTVALNPLFAILQIPAADYAEREGYKPFVLRGWTTRSFFILGAALIPLLPSSVPSAWKIRLILLLLSGFAAARGLSMCGYMPWLTQLIPETIRGRFLAVDTLCIYTANTVTMLGSSALLHRFPSPRTYSVLFGASFLFALASLRFLKKLPASAPLPRPLPSRTHPPWLSMIRYTPFARIMAFTVVWNIGVAGTGVVWVPFFREVWGASPSLILILSAYSGVIAGTSSFLVGPLADRTGSRPLIALGSTLVILNQIGWLVTAGGVVSRSILFAVGIIFISSVGHAMQNLSVSRLLMGTVPALGRSHFFALHSVFSSLSLGLMPLVWGIGLDALKALDNQGGLPPLGPWQWNRYSLLYTGIVSSLLAAQLLRRRLLEPRALTTQEVLRILLVESPQKLAARVLISARRFRPVP